MVRLYACGVGKPRLSLLITVFIMDSRDILVPIGFYVIDFIKDFEPTGCFLVHALNYVLTIEQDLFSIKTRK